MQAVSPLASVESSGGLWLCDFSLGGLGDEGAAKGGPFEILLGGARFPGPVAGGAVLWYRAWLAAAGDGLISADAWVYRAAFLAQTPTSLTLAQNACRNVRSYLAYTSHRG